MKKLILILSVVTLMSCSKEDEPIDRDVIVFHSTTFVSEPYEVPKGSSMGIEFEGTETRYNVIRFNENGRITYFKADDFENILPGTMSTTGAYDLNYPTVSNIIAVHIFEEESLTIQNVNNKMSFTAGGMKYTASAKNFD